LPSKWLACRAALTLAGAEVRNGASGRLRLVAKCGWTERTVRVQPGPEAPLTLAGAEVRNSAYARQEITIGLGSQHLATWAAAASREELGRLATSRQPCTE
jgi:hypothetical protein